MSAIEVQPATVDRWADVARVVGHGDGATCWCQWFWVPTREFEALKTPGRRDRLREMTERDPAPGLVAYVDGQAAGWCGFGPRAEMRRLERSRTIPRLDERAVWSIVCFNVRREFRGRGVTEALLAAAVDYARSRGVECVEAYPVDTDGDQIKPNGGYVGVLSVFERLGFTRVGETTAVSQGHHRVIVRLELSASSG